MNADDRLCLARILVETGELLKANDNISWEGLSPAEVAMDLEHATSQLQSGDSPNWPHLRLLFAPTGVIQECAITNDWAEEYRRLASAFDAIADKKA